MTGRAEFGDFLREAHRQLGPAAGAGRAAAACGSVEEVIRSLLRVVTVMGRYVQDITTAVNDGPARTAPALQPWPRACIQAREALASSAGFLIEHGSSRRWPAAPAASPLARRLDAVTVSLTTGRDLLQTHFAPTSGGARRHRSEWAHVVTSQPVSRALLAEIGSLARQVACQGADLALSPIPGEPEGVEDRRRLNAACQWLWVADASVRAAHQREPVSARDHDLLQAIPVNALPPRRIPGGREPVTALCEGVITSAERVRHLAWVSAEQTHSSPDVTVTSLRQIAETSTVTSHNCEILLMTLAAGAAHTEFGGISAELAAAAGAAGRARNTWLHAAHAVGQITTGTRGYLSPAAAEASDLALWTGRLAYADPQWMLASGPARPARLPEDLVTGPEELPLVIAAVHQACETLTQLTHTEHAQVRAAAQAGHILVPTRSLPDNVNIARPFARAPQDRVDLLLSGYGEAAQASHQAATAVGEIAAATRAPSRALTAARACADTSLGRTDPDHPAGPGSHHDPHDVPGPVERTLLGLGVNRPDLLQHGAAIDRAGERLIIDAAAELEPSHRRPAATPLNRSTATAALINHALAASDPRATALLRRPEQRGPEQAEPEP